MAIDRRHMSLLRRAVRKIRPMDVEHYFELRVLLRSREAVDRARFREKFAKYYGLRRAFLGEALEQRYFDLLFEFRRTRQKDPYTRVLVDLHKLENLSGDHVLFFSFVSKLVSIHDESKPLYDRHVRDFFGLMPPVIGNVEFRIAGFLQNLESIRRTYEGWAADPSFDHLVAPLLRRLPRVKECHASRVCDFLVWAIGNQQLCTDASRTQSRI